HVWARNATDAEARALSEGAGLPLETTIVETHSTDTPFIFESLKNYFRKAGLRVFAAIHPIVTVRRQWERIVSFGGPHEGGPREASSPSQIDAVAPRAGPRRTEHEIYSVRKCVFTAVEDFRAMGEAVRALGARLASRRGRAAEVQSARAFLK